ncbi:unnamed protein product, partial [Brachionus calyciflorus]
MDDSICTDREKIAENFTTFFTSVFNTEKDSGLSDPELESRTCKLFEIDGNDEVPKYWKQANVTPLHKNGSKLESSNYRPVSLTSVPGKIMERIAREELVYFLIENELISPKQHGFMPKKSCVTNLIETLDKITEALSSGYAVDILYTDFSKAFDKRNPNFEYSIIDMEGTRHNLLVTRSERDLGVQITDDHKWEDQVNIAVNKSNRAL